MGRAGLKCFFAILVAGVLSVGPESASGQATTGSIVGTVTDPSKAVIVGAEVLALNERTGVSYKGRTDQVGDYVIHALPPSVYAVTVTMQGFQTATSKDIALDIDQKQKVDFQLKVGEQSTVTVTAAPTLLQTQTAEQGTVIGTEDILDLPLEGRNFSDLTLLVPGVVPIGSNTNALALSVNGQREFANSIQIDGIETTSNRTQDLTVIPSVDSVQEFKVSTAGYNAEFGRASGGVISIQTKAGSNQFHGSAYEFFRPDNFAARPFSFGNPSLQSNLKQHNYGGTIGGPIKKDKAFFFASYEGIKHHDAFTEIASTPPSQFINVLPDGSVDLSKLIDPFDGTPTPIFDPAVSIACNGTCSKQFPGNIIPANRVSKAGLNTLLNFFPKPNLPGTGNGFFRNFQVNSPVDNTGNTGDGRFDLNISQRDQLYVVYHYQDMDILITDPYHGATVVAGGGDADQAQKEHTRAQELSVSEIHTFSNRMLNEFRVGFNRFNEQQFSLLNGQDLSDKFGMGNVTVPGFPATVGYPQVFTVSGYIAGGSTFKPFLELDNNLQFVDNFSITQARHDLKFGVDVRKLSSHPDFSLFPTGFQFYGFPFANITGDPTFSFFDANSFWGNGGSDIADLLLGLPLDVDIGLQLTKPHTKSWELNFYGQDTYRVTPKVTLNYGLRYEYQAPYTEENNFISNFNPASGQILLAGRGGNSGSLVDGRHTNFAPRLGVNYQVHPTTVVRAGFGIFYSPENDGREDFLTKNAPFAAQSVFKNGNTAPAQYQIDAGVPRVTTINIPPGASSIDPATLPNGTLEKTFSVLKTIKTGYSEMFNAALQQQFGPSLSFEVAYVGSRSHHLSYQIADINANSVLTPNLGIIQSLGDYGNGNYNSLQLKVTKRASRNLSFLGSYTWGHNLDNGPAPFDLGRNNDNPQDPKNLKIERGNSDNDVRQNFVFSGLYRLPIGRGQTFFSNWSRTSEFLLGGWQFNVLLEMRTGSPVNVVRGSGNPSFPGLRPDLVGNPVLARGDRTLLHYFNTAAFSTARFACDPTDPTCQPNAPGTAGRNLVYGPGFVNLDSSIFKEFAPSDRIKLQTRLEAFNTANTPHLGNPIGDMTNGEFGQIIGRAGTQKDNRVIQIAGKIIF